MFPEDYNENVVSFSELTKDELAYDPFKNIQIPSLADILDHLLSGLTPREETVLRLRFALDGGEPMTLRKIGQSLDNLTTKGVGITTERVRGIEAKALRRVSHTSRVSLLKDFIS